MWRGQLKYLTLWLFLAGVILIVFLQFLSGKNVNRLIQGNKKLLGEVSIQNNLRLLEADVLTVESDIRGIVISKDTANLQEVRVKSNQVKDQMVRLEKMLNEDNDAAEVNLLVHLVNEKLSFGQNTLQVFRTEGKDAGEQLINSKRGKVIRDSIVTVITRLDQQRQDNLQRITSSIESNANKARAWGFFLAAIAGLACLFTFLHVLNIGRQQQLMIARLNESEKRSKEAASVKEQFLANMSHEIRTPMNAILGFTNLLKKTNLDVQQAQYIDFIHSSGENLLTLINDILDLSKIEAGMMQLESAPFSLNGLISSVEIMFREKAKGKGLKLVVQVDQSIHDTLSGDAIRLTQVLINLLSNAIKFTEKGTVQLQITPLQTSDEMVLLQFVVKDTGIGIDLNKKQNIFERFQQAETETTRRFGGSGLGLSIVKQLVDMQHGTVQVQSEPGNGAAFTVVLPFVPVAGYEIDRPVTSTELNLTIKNACILIAEDNQMNQQLIRHLMKHWQIDYVLVNNGKEAIAALQQNTFSLVLMDIQMPEMDGYDATLVIRNELKLNVPIVAMTAHAMAGEKERCLSFGMNEYISKPIKEAELYHIIEQYTAPEAGTERAPENENVINLQYLKELSMGDAEFEHAIIRQFIVQVPEELELLKEAINKRNLTRIKNIAHGMKSSVAYVGLTEKLHPFLQRMETEAVLNNKHNHFEEDYAEVELICNIALTEVKGLQVYTS